MARSDWIKVFALSGIAILTPLFWVDLSPRAPELPTYQAGQDTEQNYRAGGSGCSPDALARLGGAKALSERDRCTEAVEEHRLKSDDLIQQTRAADAAQASARLSYDVAVMTLIGVVLGFFTVAAAALAAFYARRAYLEAEKSRKHQERATRLQLQPFVYWKETSFQIVETTERTGIGFEITLFNTGATPALELVTNLKGYFRDSQRAKRLLLDKVIGQMLVPPNGRRRVLGFLELSAAEWSEVKKYQSEIVIDLHVQFNSRFAKNRGFSECRAGGGDDLTTGDLYIDDGEPDAPIIPNLLPDIEAGKQVQN